MKRGFFFALLLSAVLHVLVLTAPGWHFGSLVAADDRSSIEARLIAPAQQAKPSTKVVPRRMKKNKAPAAPVPDPAPAPDETEEAHGQPPAAIAAAESTNTEPGTAPTVPEPAAEVPGPTETQTSAEPQTTDHAAADPIPENALVLPRSGRIRYSITHGDGGFVVGQSVEEWNHDGKRYSIRATSETTGIAAIFKPAKVVQTSEGSFRNGELKPEHFHFDRGNNDIVSADFDWQAQKVTLSDGQVVSITEGAEDFLSMFFQLTQAAQRGEGFEMAVATGRKVERYIFEWLGEEALNLPAGHFNAWHVLVRAASGGKDTTEVWLGREVAGLPIKVRNTDRKGNVFDQIAEEIDYEGK